MTISCLDEEIIYNDVYVGEVWLAGGQSNMEFFLHYDADRDEALETGENSDVFFFDYPEVSYEGQFEKRDYSTCGFWRPCTKANMDYYSAVAYYFAIQIQRTYNIPVGILACNWGGTSASCWMREDYLEGTKGQIWLDEYRESIKNLDDKTYIQAFETGMFAGGSVNFDKDQEDILLRGLPEEQMLALVPTFNQLRDTMLPQPGPRSPWRPCGLYDTMLKKVAPYGIRGVIWYQGESDDIHADVYDVVLENMINCWRDLWKEELPFLLTQIAPLNFWFTGEIPSYPVIRAAQETVSERMRKVWITTIGDLGISWDVHPKKKKPVGERLALLARGHVYGEDILCDPPKGVSIDVVPGEVRLTFANAEDGLVLKGNTINDIECIIDEKTDVNVSFRVADKKILIESKEISQESTIEIRFAMQPYHEVNIYNKAGVPVRPFVMNNR